MSAPSEKGRLLLVGGSGGLVGRNVLAELLPAWKIRSVHRHPAPDEARLGVEWVPADAATVPDWTPLLEGVDVVLNVAWYRFGSERRFAPLGDGLERLIHAARSVGVRRFVQVSVPDSPASLEEGLPYMVHKRRVDRALEGSGLAYSIVRPTMLFAPRDVLITVMLRTMHRYHRFPMFGDGNYHVSPLSARDLARILAREARASGSRNVTAGGPERFRYRDLTDLLFRALGRTPRYFRLSPKGAVRLARLLETVGSTLLYAYEVEWLLSDMLGLPPYEGLDTPLEPVQPFVTAEAHRLTR